ncbi:hypothetical protein ACFY2R_14660 [Micromonospora olivasterospora]|uniref:hypothetical protein n=1 Tax=Micromonospora olivasterospora TaxID=1880 RepID=UPI0036943368
MAPRASETGNTDRKGQPMSKAGSPAGPVHPDPRRGLGPQTGPANGAGLPPADGRTRRRAPQGLLRCGRPAGRTALGGDAPPHAIRDLRRRRHPGQRVGGVAGFRRSGRPVVSCPGPGGR